MFFQYGASTCCIVNYPTKPNYVEEIGPTTEQPFSVSHISNDLDKLEQRLIQEEIDCDQTVKVHADRTHELVGGEVDDIGITVVSVIVREDDDHICGVIFTEPNYLPQVV